MSALPSLWFGTDICHPRNSSNEAPSGVLIERPTLGVEPLKNFAISACVPVGSHFPLSGETVTTIREERITSPELRSSATQPVGSGVAVIPYPGAARASSRRRLRLTRTMFGAYGSTSTVESPRLRISCCAIADLPPIANMLLPVVAPKQQSVTALRNRLPDAFIR